MVVIFLIIQDVRNVGASLHIDYIQWIYQIEGVKMNEQVEKIVKDKLVEVCPNPAYFRCFVCSMGISSRAPILNENIEIHFSEKHPEVISAIEDGIEAGKKEESNGWKDGINQMHEVHLVEIENEKDKAYAQGVEDGKRKCNCSEVRSEAQCKTAVSPVPSTCPCTLIERERIIKEIETFIRSNAFYRGIEGYGNGRVKIGRINPRNQEIIERGEDFSDCSGSFEMYIDYEKLKEVLEKLREGKKINATM